ncbi:MAG: ARMT1-like domain-containing protein [Candidatus Omnitrophica bacterium]|nr:ARMT1-like domain-containing protein [Candidatus Omnitrophota bacterium]
MRTYLECIPCFFSQAIESGRLITGDEIVHKELIDDLAKLIPEFSLNSTPPEMAYHISKIVKARLGDRDLYKQIKEKSNKMALELYPRLKDKVEKSNDRLLMAVEIAIAGNVIDYGAKNSLDIDKEIKKLFQEGFYDEGRTIFDYEDFQKDLRDAKQVLYLGDNAGEIVFDRVLIEEFFKEKEVIYVVREKPIINDVVMKDAHDCGIDKIAKVISSGVESPGTILKYCSKDFIDIFNDAELIISKGQGNYEALSSARKGIYFLMRAKCPVIARHVGAAVGDIVLKKS